MKMIIDTDDHGRLLVCDGFGGDDINGYTHRWTYGTVAQLQHGDTFGDLDARINESGTTLMQCVTTGNDSDRQLLTWTGNMIAAVAAKYWRINA